MANHSNLCGVRLLPQLVMCGVQRVRVRHDRVVRTPPGEVGELIPANA